MSISEHERQVLESIERELASTGPQLASMLAIFARLTAGEDMPVRERLRRALDVPSAEDPRASARAAVRTTRRHRTMARLRRQSAWVICLVVAIALVALALTVDRGAGRGVCPVTQTAACRQLSGSGSPAHRGPD